MNLPDRDNSLFRKSTPIFTVTGVLIMLALIALSITIITLSDDLE